jgi:hypothetical protein
VKIRAAPARALFGARASEDNLWAAWYSYPMARRRRPGTLRRRGRPRRRLPKRSRAASDLREILKFQDHSSEVIERVRLAHASEPAFVFTALFLKP